LSNSQVIFEIDQEILENIKKVFADRSSVEVGLLNMGGDDGVKALTHEFGNDIAVTPAMSGYFKQHFGSYIKKPEIHIPQRSFMRKTVAQKPEEFLGWLAATADIILESIVYGNWARQLDTFGRVWVGYIKECFDTRGFGQWAPLSKLTIMKKGNDIPLVETGRMRDHIQSTVVGQ
jgi:hypothetical protein